MLYMYDCWKKLLSLNEKQEKHSKTITFLDPNKDNILLSSSDITCFLICAPSHSCDLIVFLYLHTNAVLSGGEWWTVYCAICIFNCISLSVFSSVFFSLYFHLYFSLCISFVFPPNDWDWKEVQPRCTGRPIFHNEWWKFYTLQSHILKYRHRYSYFHLISLFDNEWWKFYTAILFIDILTQIFIFLFDTSDIQIPFSIMNDGNSIHCNPIYWY